MPSVNDEVGEGQVLAGFVFAASIPQNPPPVPASRYINGGLCFLYTG